MPTVEPTPYPLKLTDFESYLVADDRIDYPMTFVMRLELTGSLRQDAWSRALHRTLPRHPLLSARITRVIRGWQWVPASGSEADMVPHLWDQLPDWDALPRLDLRRGAGVRFWTGRSESQVTVTGEFHHACCDGVGALQFFGDWLAAYDAELTGDLENIAWERLRPEMLRDRGKLRWRAPSPEVTGISRRDTFLGSLVTLREIRDFAREVWLWGSRSPQPLVGVPQKETPKETPKKTRKENTSSPQSRSAFSEIIHETLNGDETVQLRQSARLRCATVNDQLLSSLFETLRAWNRQHRSSDSDWLVITMPTSLRQSADNRLPAANVIGYGFIARQSKAIDDPRELLPGIAAETKAIRTQGLGNYFLTGLRWARRIPGGLRFATRRSVCHATAVFSNLGDPQRRMNPRLPRSERRIVVGDLVLQRVLAVPPLRPQTRAVFLASQSADELTLCLSYDQHTLNADAGRWLLKDWTQRLRHVIHEVGSESGSVIGDGRQQIETSNKAAGEPCGE